MRIEIISNRFARAVCRRALMSVMCLSMAMPLLTQAKEATPMAANEEVEKTTIAISEELRCLVCQNQTIAASDAGLAQDLKRQVRTMVSEGKSKQEILDYMVQRYGDFVLYRPPVKPTTYALWGGPLILMVLGVSILLFNLKHRKKVVSASPLSDEQSKQLNELLAQNSVTPTKKVESKSNAEKNEGDA